MNAPVAPPPPSRPTSTRRCFRSGPTRRPTASSTSDGVKVEKVMGKDMLAVAHEALRALAEAAFTDINHLLRPRISQQLRKILDDPEATDNDKFVAYDFLKNANIAAGGVLPMCQDTGTAIIMGKKGRLVFTDGDDEAALAEGARDAYLKTQSALFAARAALHVRGEEHQRPTCRRRSRSMRRARTPTSSCSSPKAAARPTRAFLFQATPSILTHDRLLAFLKEKS